MHEDLIQRLQSADRGSRELSIAIVLAINPGSRLTPYDDKMSVIVNTNNEVLPIDDYTTSVDAALLLIPKDWELWKIGQNLAPAGSDRSIVWWAEILHKDEGECFVGQTTRAMEHGMTIPLAVCAAALMVSTNENSSLASQRDERVIRCVWLPSAIETEIKTMAVKTGKTKNDVLCELLREGLQQMEK